MVEQVDGLRDVLAVVAQGVVDRLGYHYEGGTVDDHPDLGVLREDLVDKGAVGDVTRTLVNDYDTLVNRGDNLAAAARASAA